MFRAWVGEARRSCKALLPSIIMGLAFILFFLWLEGATWESTPPAKRTVSIVYIVGLALLPAAAGRVAHRSFLVRWFMFRPTRSPEEVRPCGRAIALVMVAAVAVLLVVIAYGH